MNAIGLAYLIRMGCVCGKDALIINNRRFYVRSRVGEGGFSYIDLIEDARTHKDYALKRITCHTKEEERMALQEVEYMKTFRHHNIIPLEEYTMVKIERYTKSVDILSEVHIVMPYYSRGSVQDMMERLKRKSEKFSEDRIWDLFLGTCEAIKVFHKHNPPYAHRDVKPANIMMSDEGDAVLMDLGSTNKARVQINTPAESHRLQDEAEERCSMLYRAPELFNVELGANIDERTDIWSLGCVLYAMAFLESPFEQVHNQGGSIALATLGGRIKFPENSGYSSSLQEVICFLMKTNPAERPFIDAVIQRVEAIHNTFDNRV